MKRLLRRLAALAALGTRRRVDLWTMIASLLDSGMELERALDVAIATAGAERQSVTAWILSEWRRALARNRFAAELALWVPASEAMIFANARQVSAAKLFAGAARIADVRARQTAILLQTLTLPVILTVMVALILWASGTEFIPVMERISPRASWDMSARLLGDVSLWVAANLFELAVGAVAVPAVLAAVIVTWSGRGRAVADRWPPFSIYRTLTGASFTFVMVEFLRSGADLNDRMFEALRRPASRYVASRIAAIQRGMASGRGVGAAMTATGHGWPDPSLVPTIAALDGRPGWEENLAVFVSRWVERSEQALRTRAMALNGALMLVVAAITAIAINGMFAIMGSVQA